MAKKIMLTNGNAGYFSVSNECGCAGGKTVEIHTSLGGIQMSAKYTVEKKKKPKIFQALENLEIAMLEEGAKVMEEIIIG